ncbi:hypothetical protein FDP41_008087 [Naegleria fowleri]|uniref:B box-type domain-containing protein n=1 Tax=Naegleria fowleri TaxID=5763 RepID=A0A6A5B2S7_NAEFO|nr:uncharacterized protein FDP41_008087 [Naegleria fowleri]KAF0973383.1 hypothetical protein FDP41_008087 [Naegleria fowleri]CAG4710838.1 unnamed protein product [Naegleria fowleri]
MSTDSTNTPPQVLSHSSSSSSISSMTKEATPAPCCHICKEEVDVLQEARSHCVDCNMYLCARDAKIHVKREPTHHVIDLIGSSAGNNLGGSGIGLGSHLLEQMSPRTNGNFVPNSMSFGGPAPLCQRHHIPVNTYCGTCKKLVCSACAVEEHREGHNDVNMIAKIEPEERSNLDKLLTNLRESMKDWENSHQTHDNELELESSLIEEARNRLKEEVKAVCDTLRQNLQDRQDQLFADIDEITKTQTNYVKKIIELKKVSVDYMSEFDKLHEMSGYEMMERKLTRLPQTLQAFEDLKTFFKYLTLDEVHDIQLTNTEIMYIQRELKNLGEIVKTPPKQKSAKNTGAPSSQQQQSTPGTTSTEPSKVAMNTSSSSESSSSSTSVTSHPYAPFSMEFSHVATIGKTGSDGSGNDQFKGPWDVKISHGCNCIVVSDSRNNRIQFFDLKTREYKGSLKTSKSPRYLCIEPSKDGNDSLIFSCDNHAVYKYSLPKVLSNEKNLEPVWVSGTPKKKGSDMNLFTEPAGVALCKSKKINALFPEAMNENTILVCDGDNHRVKVLRASDGKVLKTFGAKKGDDNVQLVQPECVYVSEDDQIIITDQSTHRVQIVTRKGDELSCIKIIGKEGQSNLEFTTPRGLAVDETSNHIILCDCGNNRVQVFSHVTEEFKRNFGNEGKDNSQFNKPTGVCFNDVNGELFIADYQNHRIQIFK